MSRPGDSVDPVVDPVDADPVVVHGCMDVHGPRLPCGEPKRPWASIPQAT